MLKNVLNINKRILIVLIIIIFVVICVICLFNIIPKKLDNILESNGYNESTLYEVGSNIDGITVDRSFVKYNSNNNSLLVYKFGNLEEIKAEGENIYSRYKDNSAFTTKFVNDDKYIFVRACDNKQCFYTLGYGEELVQSVVNIKLKKDTDKVFNSIIKDKKLT